MSYFQYLLTSHYKVLPTLMSTLRDMCFCFAFEKVVVICFAVFQHCIVIIRTNLFNLEDKVLVSPARRYQYRSKLYLLANLYAQPNQYIMQLCIQTRVESIGMFRHETRLNLYTSVITHISLSLHTLLHCLRPLLQVQDVI